MREIKETEESYFKKNSKIEMNEPNLVEFFAIEKEKAENLLNIYLEKLKEKNEQIEKVDPSFFSEIIEPELKMIESFMQRTTIDNTDIDFYITKIMPFLKSLGSKIEYELAARMEYIKLMKMVEGMKDN